MAVLPLLNIITILASLAGLAMISFAIGLFNSPEMSLDVLPELVDFSGPMEFVAYFVAILVATAVATFFNAALVHCTRQALVGKPVSIRSGLTAAWRVKRRIVAYALVAATAGLIIRLLDEKLHIGGRLAAWLFSVGWSVLTFFIVPVLVLEEDATARSMFKRSGDTFVETWGESVTADFGIGLVGLLLFLPFLAIGGWVILTRGHLWLIGGILVAVFIAMSVITHALGYIVRTDLYLYARDGPDAASLGLDPDTVLKES